jgi:hypothetical protein
VTDGDGDDLVPISVRLGEVVPPEDPEDWTRPLTWVAALGMLAGPIVVIAWFALARPTGTVENTVPAALFAAAVLASGAAVTGATQLGAARAWTATLGAGLFAALGVVVLGVVFDGQRQTGLASPMLAHAFATAVGGVSGAAAAAAVAALVARWRSRPLRAIPAVAVGAAAAAFAVGALLT